MLFLRLDQALELLRACKNLRETLVIRYMMYNGLSNMEVANARIEHLDPVECHLFLPRRHWKDNQITDIDPETVKLQIMYTGSRKKGPLIRRRDGAHVTRMWLWQIVKNVAQRTAIPDAQAICPLILKRTFARIFLRTPGNTLLGLQKAFSHFHIWSTGHYLRCVLDDLKEEKIRMMERIRDAKTKSTRLVS